MDTPDVLRPGGSIPWSGRSRARLSEAAARIDGRHAAHPSDWWTPGVLLLAVLHVLLFVALQGRPGAIAVVLWRWGPPVVVALTAILLLMAFISATRGRSWNWQRAAGFAGLCAVIATLPAYVTFPSAYDSRPSSADIRLPLDGAVTIAWGGATASTNYHVSSPAERWAYDLLITVDGRSHRGDGRALADYYAYDRPVLAPASGRVVSVHDGDPDALPGRPNRSRGGGNRIVLEIAPNQYLFLVHLRPRSIRVAPGEWVPQGSVVARAGSSGNSSEPHVHMHLQDTATSDRGQGIPFYFSRYRTARDGVVVARGMPVGGIQRGRFVGEIVASTVP
jgi:murein DD-endopeptidase MepM/ murein hydrolase activator NlpD